MIFRYNSPIYKNDNLYLSEHGEKEIPEYKIDYMKNGGVCLKKCGTKPIYDIIQANKVNCDLNSVLETCVHQNQLAICDIDDVTQAIADFSGLSSMADWYAGMKHLDNIWAQMPLEAREQFNSSPVKFINSIGDVDFIEKLNHGYVSYNDSYSKRLEVNKNDVVIDNTNINTDVNKEV